MRVVAADHFRVTQHRIKLHGPRDELTAYPHLRQGHFVSHVGHDQSTEHTLVRRIKY